MAQPLFLLQIVHNDTGYLVARLPGGGPLERDLIQICKDAILSKGVGVFRTEAQVARAVEEGIREALLSVKRDARKTL